MEDHVVSQKTADWLLVASLRILCAERAARADSFVRRIEGWRHRLSALCVATALAWSVWGEKSSSDLMLLLLAAVCLPQVFGWWIGEQVVRQNNVPADDEIGLLAADIIRAITNISIENACYVPAFVSLLQTVSDEEPEASLLRAEELDAYGDDARQLTDLVRAAYA